MTGTSRLGRIGICLEILRELRRPLLEQGIAISDRIKKRSRDVTAPKVAPGTSDRTPLSVYRMV